MGYQHEETSRELRYFRDGATLVISLDGFNWLPKRRCNDKGTKKRNKELQVVVSSDQANQADEELQTIACILEPRGHCRSSTLTGTSLVSTPPRCLPSEPARHPTLTSLASFLSECPKEAPWTRFIFNMRDIFSFFKSNSNLTTQRDIVDNTVIIFCDEDIPLPRFGDFVYTEDYRTSTGDTAWDSNANNVLGDLKNSITHDPNTNNSNGNQHELAIIKNLNDFKNLPKSYQMHNPPGVLPRNDINIKKRKSVSFDDDVVVYLFDQESPTMELHPEACTSVPDATLEESGLEWEDDFSALEKNCHFQCVRQSQLHTLSMSTQSSAALSRRLFLSQTCLFLTHVTESDLEPQPALD